MQLAAALALVVLSGFFAGSETAVYRAHWIRLTDWSRRRVAGAGLALRLVGWREPTVIAALVGTNLCSVFATVLVSKFVADEFGPAWTGAGVVVLVALTLVFGEYLPKALAQASPNRWLSRMSLPLAVSLGLFAPAVLLLAGVARVFATPFSRTRERLSLSRHDFLAAIRQREKQNGRPADDRHGPAISALVARLFRFSGMKLAEAAVPLERVRSVAEGAGREEVLAVVEEHGFSRIPVFRGERSNIVGVVLAKDLLAGGQPPVRRIDRLSEESRAIEVLNRMQRVGGHIAVVVDAEGRTEGIVTLEDILEELVGEIRSED
jgi:CBS domain containing-hemolysin-like protein